MSDPPDVERLLERALRPVEPPADLASRLRGALGDPTLEFVRPPRAVEPAQGGGVLASARAQLTTAARRRTGIR